MAKKIPIYPRKKYAKRRAKEFILQSKIKSLPINPFAVCKQEGIIVKSVTEAEECIDEIDPFEVRDNPDCDAKTYLTSKGKYVIIYDDSVFSRGRIIWTIAHELGHIILKHLTQFEQTEIHKGLTDAENEVLEKEANAFASEFLAPAEILLSCNCVTKNKIIKLCGLSDEAAEYKEEYLKNYKPDEAFQNTNQQIYQQFYNFIHNKEFFHAIHYRVCPVCKNYHFSPKEKLCRICGRKISARTAIKGIIYNDGPEMKIKKAILCPKCSEPQKQKLNTTCNACGTTLVNKCTNISCNKTHMGTTRYCFLCGAPTSFYTEGVLPDWEIAREHQAKYKTVIHILEKDQDTGRIFTEWQYVLDYIKQSGGFSIYQELKNSVAKIDFDTLFIYSDSPIVKNKLKNSEIADYIMQQVKKSINQPVLEILLLDIDDNGNVLFKE